MANERPAQQSDIKQLISKGLEQGYLTYAEVNDHLPDDIVDAEQIEDIIGMINGMGIDVHEVAPDAETLLLNDGSTGNREIDDTAAEEAAAALTALDSEGGRTTDPVRMYMREMGTVELLTREGEIAIAKRIEEGLGQVQAALGSFPWTIELLLEEYELHKAGKKRLAEVVVGYNSPEFDAEGRYVELRFDTPSRKMSIVSAYFPSGSSGEERQQAKFRFLAEFYPHLLQLKAQREFILCGDVNIAHQNIDLKNWRSNQKNSGFLPEERAWMTKLLDTSGEGGGLVDVYRQLQPATTDTAYTWWSNRGQAYANNVGWRLDYHLATPAMAALARTESIYKGEKFSDHAPITVEYEFAL